MDASLLLLYRLRFKAYFRRYGKTLRTVKGVLLTLLGVGMVAFWVWSSSLGQKPGAPPPDPALVAKIGPPILLAYMTMMLFFGVENAIIFSPPEIEFLFPGPFSRRQLLAFKLVAVVFGVFCSSIFMAFVLRNAAGHFLFGYLALVALLLSLQLLAMILNLASSTVAAFAKTWRRRLLLAALLVLAAGVMASVYRDLQGLTPPEILDRVLKSTAYRVATAPFRPFVSAFTARQFWPDFAAPMATCLAMLGTMTVIVLLLDAQYLETSAQSSRVLYDKVARMRRGGGIPGRGTTVGGRVRSRMKMLPWLGGAGPTLTRQLLTARRESSRLLLPIAVAATPLGIAILLKSGPQVVDPSPLFIMFPSVGGWFAFLASAIVAFDFRSEIDRMEELKSLPLSPLSIVLGEIATPILALTLPLLIFAAITAAVLAHFSMQSLLTVSLVVPFIMISVELDNLLFLAFPARGSAANPADFAAFGRAMVLIFVKVVILGISAGAAAVAGLGVYYLVSGVIWVALAVAFAVGMIFAVALIPVIAAAYERFDVVRDSPA